MKYKNEEKTLLILDVDETLIFATDKPLNRPADFIVFEYYVYKRPYLEQFLEIIKDHFLLAIWSSASDEYVDAVAKQIIPASIELEFVWGRSRCNYKRNLGVGKEAWYDDLSHYHYIKPLKKVKRKGYKLDRMLIVDDTPHKSSDNFGNAIYPKAYQGEMEDNELEKLAEYLQTLKDRTNIRRIEKRNWRNQV